MNLMRRLISTALVAPVVILTVQAQEASLTPDQIKEVVEVDSVTIPTPGEFFAAIDKQGRPAWSQLVKTGAPKTSTSRAQIALALGTLVADGFIATEAEDSQAVKNIGKEIINLAKKLNVSQSVLGRGNSINDFASNNDWSALREELEATQNEVKLDMADQKDTNLITLVTIGAWLRGTELTSGIVTGNYSPESAKLLRQPAIVDYLLGQLNSLPKNLQEDELVTKIKGSLEKARADVAAPVPSAENVKGLHATMTDAVTAISTES